MLTLKVSMPLSHFVSASGWLGSSEFSSTAWVPHVDTNLWSVPDWHWHYAVPPTESPIVTRFKNINLPVSQDSHLPSVWLSPNRVRQDFDVTREDQYPLFAASPVSNGHLSPVSPAMSGDRHQLDRSGLPRLSLEPALVRGPRCRCRSPTGLLISRSWHPHWLLIRRCSSSTRIPHCWYSWPRSIGSGFPSLRQILHPS